MSVGKCDYQLLTPGVGRFEPAPVYPDLVVAARMATAARSARPRRFAFCQATPIGPGSDEVSVRAVYQGFQNPDGSCVLLLSGQPYGYYQSIDAAFHYATGSHLYLTWLEPDHALPDGQEPTAAVEARHNPASVWLVALPFIAHGPHDARLRALETAAHLEPTTPGLTRRSALLFNGEDPTQPVTLFCPIEPCMRPPFHHGQHHPETELPKPEAETRPPEPAPLSEPDVLQPREPEPEPAPGAKNNPTDPRGTGPETGPETLTDSETLCDNASRPKPESRPVTDRNGVHGNGLKAEPTAMPAPDPEVVCSNASGPKPGPGPVTNRDGIRGTGPETEPKTGQPELEPKTETTHDPEASRDNAPGSSSGPGAGQSAVSPADGGEN